jgi:hypothetical protein
MRETEIIRLDFYEEFETGELGLNKKTGPRKTETDGLRRRTDDSEIPASDARGVKGGQDSAGDVIAIRRDCVGVE